MPAFINAHEHIYSAMARGLSIKGYDPKGFLDILDGMWWTIDRHLTNEQTRQSARVTFLDSIKNGVTTVFDHHASFGQIHDSLFAIEDAAEEFGLQGLPVLRDFRQGRKGQGAGGSDGECGLDPPCHGRMRAV